jgi:Fe-S cluster assembly ATP-binding protein
MPRFDGPAGTGRGITLEVEHLTLRRHGRTIVDGVSLAVRSGQVHGLLGPNGSGKSSLAYAVMGCSQYRSDGGRIRLAGRDITALAITERARRGITLAWQEPARFEGLSVTDYLRAGMGGPADLALVDRSLRDVGLDPADFRDRAVDRSLSGGERKRIELAAVVAMRPAVAILDEPDSGVDVLTVDGIATLVRRLAADGTAVLLITHQDRMLSAADTATLLCDGRTVAQGDPEVVRRHYADLLPAFDRRPSSSQPAEVGR